MAQRVNKLAQSLKELHLAVSSDEAYKRAQEILLGSFTQKDVKTEKIVEEKTLNELMGKTQETKEKIVEEIIIDSVPKESDGKKSPENK